MELFKILEKLALNGDINITIGTSKESWLSTVTFIKPKGKELKETAPIIVSCPTNEIEQNLTEALKGYSTGFNTAIVDFENASRLIKSKASTEVKDAAKKPAAKRKPPVTAKKDEPKEEVENADNQTGLDFGKSEKKTIPATKPETAKEPEKEEVQPELKLEEKTDDNW